MSIANFEDIIAWQKGKILYLELKRDFGATKDYWFRDQIFRAALSITNNIAEGFDRGSDKELKQFLIIARGSCAEVRSMLHIALAENTISEARHKELFTLSKDISKLLTAFIKVLATGRLTGDGRRETK